MKRGSELESTVEERVVEAIRGGCDELVGIASDLIAFDTTARMPGEPARDERRLQEYLRDAYVHKVPTLVVSIALGISALLSFVSGILLDSIRNHSKQFYELALTSYREIEALRRRA